MALARHETGSVKRPSACEAFRGLPPLSEPVLETFHWVTEPASRVLQTGNFTRLSVTIATASAARTNVAPRKKGTPGK